MIFSHLKKRVNCNPNLYMLALLLLFGAIYSLISLVNHYLFLTYAYDLGLFNNALYDYAHFRWNSNSVKLYDNILSDHFTLLHIPFSLLSWFFGTYTLLIIQIAAILFGAYGAYKYHLLRSNQPILSIFLLLHFLSMWGIYSALSYDYHDNIVAAMLVPWFLYYFHQKKWLGATFYYLGIIISKENMALWAIFLNLGLAFIYFKDKSQLKYALIFTVSACVYFLIVVKLIVPSLAAGNRTYDYAGNYSVLGNGPVDIIKNLLKRPQYIFSLLFENHLHEPMADGSKSELHWMVLVSGGITILMQPVYLIMLIPIYAQKLFSTHFLTWGINYQYSIEFVPIINFALGSQALKYSGRKKWLLVAGFTFLTLFFTYRSITYRVSPWLDKRNLAFFHYHRYKRNFNVGMAHKALETVIPPDAPLSTSSQLLPHLAFREYIYEFPCLGNAQYIAILLKSEPWEIGSEYQTEIALLKSDPSWEIIYNKNTILIFKKRGANSKNVVEIKSFEVPGAVKTIRETYTKNILPVPSKQ